MIGGAGILLRTAGAAQIRRPKSGGSCQAGHVRRVNGCGTVS